MVGHFRCETCGKKYGYKKVFEKHLDAHIREKQPTIVTTSQQDGLVDLYIDPIYPLTINGVVYTGRVRVSEEIAPTLRSLQEQKLKNEQKVHQFVDHRPVNKELADAGY